MDKELLSIAGVLIVVVLIPVIGYLAKARLDRIEGDVKSVSKDVNALGTKVNNNRDEMLRDYVNYDRLSERLTAVMKPIDDGLHRIEATMTELFRKLDSKQDKS